MNARVPVAALVELTDDQRLIARLFGLMDDRRQIEMLRYATDIATAFPRTMPAPDVAMVDAAGWVKVTPGATPNSDRDVLAWHAADHMPLPAFFDADENCWFSKVDGCQFDDGAIGHWKEIQAPAGAEA